ncbi:MAG: 2Fe-2S iron-sulfur cluster binding domain-containing protein [Rhodospirillales bacterium]|nr:2Fe-2S iron-sulfur cluster binding domain-containing protein [Rhodospirillales bacterium]
MGPRPGSGRGEPRQRSLRLVWHRRAVVAGEGTLLDLAEAAGLHPNYGCRAGLCGSCATHLVCGSVDYLQEPVGPHDDDQVLICCSTPRSTVGTKTCGSDHVVILEL